MVQVLSTNRADHLVRKSHEYLRAGVGQYWIVDPRDEVVDVYENHDGWRLLAHPDTTTPPGQVQIPAGGTVDLDLAHLRV